MSVRCSGNLASFGLTALTDMLETHFKSIESAETSAFVNLASGLRDVLRALDSIESVRALADAAGQSEGVAAKILGRIIQLAQIQIDPRYENPNDVAFAAYLRILSDVAPSLYASAKEVLADVQNCWWSTGLGAGYQGSGCGASSVEAARLLRESHDPAIP